MTDDLTKAVALELLKRGEITMAEAAELASVSRQAVLQWCQKAGLDAVQIRRSRIEHKAAQVTRALEGRPYKPPMSKRAKRAMAERLIAGRGEKK